MLVICGWSQTALAGGGALDPTFGTSGVFSGNTGTGNAAVIDSSDRLIIAGYAADSHNPYHDFALIRLLPDGTLDATFGTNGMVKTDFGQEAVGQAVGIDSQGRIVVAGTTSNNTVVGNFAVARYNSDGTLDTTFNTTGTTTTDFGHNNDQASAVAIDGSDEIIVAGTADSGTSLDFALVRYSPDGTLDTTFNGTGKVLTDFSGHDDEGSAVTIDGAGRIVMAGVSIDSSQFETFALARYTPDGSLDPTFGSGGEVQTLFSGNSWAFGVAIDSLGKIVAAGLSVGASTGNDFTLARYNSDGTLDTAFNGTGKVTTDFGASETAHSVAIDASGRLVAVGAYILNSGETSFIVARYNSDGSLDSSFGTGGDTTTSFSSGHATATSVEMDSLQRIVVAGIDTGNTFAAARYLNANADLSITKSGSSSSVPAGQPLTYTITVTNNGPDATLAELTDPLPFGVISSSSSITPSQGSCTFADPTVTCMLGSIASGAKATVTINVQPTGDVSSVTNIATVAGNDPHPSDNSASTTTTVTSAADLSVTKSGPATVAAAGSIIYSIVVTNNGPSTANGVTLTDPLSDRFIDAVSSKGPCVFAKSKGSGTLSCSIGTLAIATPVTVTVQVAAPHKKGITSNTASVTATEFDPNPANNSATATVIVQ